MHFIKLILMAIVLELLACFGFSSDQEKKVTVIRENETAEPVTINFDKPAEVTLEAEPETVYIIQI